MRGVESGRETVWKIKFLSVFQRAPHESISSFLMQPVDANREFAHVRIILVPAAPDKAVPLSPRLEYRIVLNRI